MKWLFLLMYKLKTGQVDDLPDLQIAMFKHIFQQKEIAFIIFDHQYGLNILHSVNFHDKGRLLILEHVRLRLYASSQIHHYFSTDVQIH